MTARIAHALALATLIGCVGAQRTSDTTASKLATTSLVPMALPETASPGSGFAGVEPTPVPVTAEGARSTSPLVVPAPPRLRLYGFFKPTVIVADGAVESYGQSNASGITSAGNPAYAGLPGRSRLSFQMAQSRLGLWVGEDRPLKGQVEVDFVDVAKASPTASLPRLRIAKLEWRATDHLTLLAGQDWQLVQPVNPHGADYIGALMEAGNSSFTRHQVRALWTTGPVELGAEIGMQSANNLAKDAALEVSLTPSFALRAQYNLGGSSKLGIDGIATSVLYNAGAGEVRTFAGAAGVYGDLTLGRIVNLRFEGYIGRNSANLSLLTLAQGRPGTDLHDAGAFVSAKVTATDRLALYGRLGAAAVLDPRDVVPAYSYGSAALDPPPPLGSAVLAGTGPGIKSNYASSLGMDLKLFGGLSILVEGFGYRTRFALMDVDAGRMSAVSRVVGTELALLWLL